MDLKIRQNQQKGFVTKFPVIHHRLSKLNLDVRRWYFGTMELRKQRMDLSYSRFIFL